MKVFKFLILTMKIPLPEDPPPCPMAPLRGDVK